MTFGFCDIKLYKENGTDRRIYPQQCRCIILIIFYLFFLFGFFRLLFEKANYCKH